MTNNIDCEKAKEMIKKILDLCQSYLTQDTIDAVMHYVNHDEYEMAAEGLFIDIMKLDIVPPNLSKSMCFNLVTSLELDKEVVFEPDFWLKFTEFCNNRLPD